MNESTQSLSDEERSELAAFLGDQLPASESARWNARLVRDQAAKVEAEALDAAWQCLDFLPKPSTSLGLTQRTLRLATTAMPSTWQDHTAAKQFSLRRALAVAGWIAACFFAMAAGHWTIHRTQARPTVNSQTMLPLNRLDEFAAVRDLEFLRALHQSKLLDSVDVLESNRPERETSP